MEDKYCEYPLDSKDRKLILFIYFFGYLFFFEILVLAFMNQIKISFAGNQLLANLLIYSITAMCLLPIVNKLFIKENKLELKKVLKTLAYGIIAIYAANIVADFAFTYFLGSATSENQKVSLSISSQNHLIFALLVTVIAPFVEETVFRGVIFRQLRIKHSFVFSALISGLLFGFIHVLNPMLAGNFSEIWYIFIYLFLGLIFSASYEYNKSIWAAYFLHAINNLITVLILII